MIDVPGTYRAAFFADMGDIKPSVETIPALLEMFRDKELLPTTFHEVRVPVPGSRLRLRLSSANNEWNIDFDSDRITFQKTAVQPRGANMGTAEDFVVQIVDFCGRILKRYPRLGTRLSLVTEGLMSELEEHTLREIYLRFLRPIEFYEENPPTEWKDVSVARIQLDIRGKNEQINVVTRLSRLQGEFVESNGLMPFDRIEVALDINTFQGNTLARFDEAAVADFYPKALGVRQKLLEELKGRINV